MESKYKQNFLSLVCSLIFIIMDYADTALLPYMYIYLYIPFTILQAYFIISESMQKADNLMDLNNKEINIWTISKNM